MPCVAAPKGTGSFMPRAANAGKLTISQFGLPSSVVRLAAAADAPREAERQ